MSLRLKWVNSAGGPLLLLEERLRPDWKGHDGAPTGRGGRTDYERACDVDDYVGLIEVGPGRALVLGDEPMQTTWLPSHGAGGVLIRWQWADSEESALNSVGGVPEESWEPTGLTLHVSGRDLLLFDSANPGDDPGEGLTIQLERGPYEIATALCQPDAATSLVLHRFVRAAFT